MRKLEVAVAARPARGVPQAGRRCGRATGADAAAAAAAAAARMHFEEMAAAATARGIQLQQYDHALMALMLWLNLVI
jgi:hypothetical protein